eukprot:15353401-Ditylum_brightwellii.AAC.1
MVEHVFPKKDGQIQKHHMQRNLRLVGGVTIERMGSPSVRVEQPLDDNRLLDILEYGVPASWHREFTVQEFDPVDQGLRKYVEFCTCLESYEPSANKPKDKKSLMSRNAGKRKADTPTDTVGEKKFYCNMHSRITPKSVLN